MRSVGGTVWTVKNTGVRKKTHSVFEVLFPAPILISIPDQVKWSNIRVTPIHISALNLGEMHCYLHIACKKVRIKLLVKKC